MPSQAWGYLPSHPWVPTVGIKNHFSLLLLRSEFISLQSTLVELSILATFWRFHFLGNFRLPCFIEFTLFLFSTVIHTLICDSMFLQARDIHPVPYIFLILDFWFPISIFWTQISDFSFRFTFSFRSRYFLLEFLNQWDLVKYLFIKWKLTHIGFQVNFVVLTKKTMGDMEETDGSGNVFVILWAQKTSRAFLNSGNHKPRLKIPKTEEPHQISARKHKTHAAIETAKPQKKTSVRPYKKITCFWLARASLSANARHFYFVFYFLTSFKVSSATFVELAYVKF